MGIQALMPIRFGQQINWTFEVLDGKGKVVSQYQLPFNPDPDEIEKALDKFEDLVAKGDGDIILSSERAVAQFREQADTLIRAIDSELLPFKIKKYGEELNQVIDLIKAFEFRYASRYRRAV
jgi:archaellum biogenesis ATPase FlaH